MGGGGKKLFGFYIVWCTRLLFVFGFLTSFLSILLDLVNFENCWNLWNFVWDLFVSLLAIYLFWLFGWRKPTKGPLSPRYSSCVTGVLHPVSAPLPSLWLFGLEYGCSDGFVRLSGLE